MKKFIPSAYAEYGRYIDEFRGIPFYRDALKPVERRLLVALHDIARKKTVKCAKVVGHTIGSYHPHGDASTYGTLVNMVNRGWAVGQGNFGLLGLKPARAAAYRYTEVRANLDLDAMAFELIKHVPWFDPEKLGEEQPQYLAGPIPIGLIGEGIIQGITFNTTKIPRYNLLDLIHRLISVLKHEVDPNEQLYTIIPQIANCTVAENNPGDIEKILSTGKGTVVLYPKLTVTSRGVHVWGAIPTGMGDWESKSDNEKNPRPYNIIDLTNKNGFQVLFEPINGVVDQEFINIIYKITQAKIHFKCNFVVDDGTVKQLGIDDILKTAYFKWVDLLKANYEDKLLSLQERLFDYEVIAIVRDIINSNGLKLTRVDDIVQIFNTSYTQKHQNISEDMVRSVCSKYNIKKLVEVSLDTKSIQIEIDNVKKTIKDITVVAYNKLCGYTS